MDISKAPNEKKLYLCKWYFRAGCIFLPFVWAVNTIWFFDEAFRKPTYPEQSAIKKYVIMSGIGTFIWLVLIIFWVSLFQAYRVEWGEFSDSLTFILPMGIA